MDAEEYALRKCKDLVEEKLGWEASETWTNQDYHLLSEKIFHETEVNLSVATLKRIWGKVKYESKPTTTTLNTLAKFIGYENWRALKQANQSVGDENPLVPHHNAKEAENLSSPLNNIQVNKKRRHALVAGAGFCVAAALLIFLFVKGDKYRTVNPDDFSFTSKKVVSEGVPNSVIFDYDATAAQTDSVYIQQSWDASRSKKVLREKHQHTSIYYTPGFFHAKLVVNGEVIKKHKLLISTKDWIAMVKRDPVPVYFDSTAFRQPGKLSVSLETLKAMNIPLQPDVPWVSYYNVRDFGNITTDDFIFETEIRNEYKEGAAACQRATVLLLTDDENPLIIHLSVKGCVSDLSLSFDKNINGRENDLSAFGVDFSEWVKLRVEVSNKAGKIFVNNVLAYDTEFLSSAKIIGFIVRFQGTGAVNYVKLRNTERSVYDENFD